MLSHVTHFGNCLVHHLEGLAKVIDVNFLGIPAVYFAYLYFVT